MAAPNIISATSIYGKSVQAELGTSTAQILTCPAEKVLKINTIILCFDDDGGTHLESAVGCTVKVFDSSASTSRSIAGNVPVPNKTTLVVIGKDSPIYLEESDRIDAYAATASRVDMIISYEELDDA